ncbi:thiol reductant ABC exporter subunit CydD [Curtobacterium flaccumfaciens]|uniref:thiol reductant ABC exporter subunit CydD n=1 Tax=Curtobacterium flaccumfaciens TaxID=2035 RepID=UPI001BDF5C76|nr:thiol reductant ABC exporter subunit CydD [Curtobacterium flaccumfaciens]MBT1606067.1 thiol reductant ABC exporter subunit CydD [Curtobacterium flaccumfaciens pv. betae]MBT1656095.1 thiol reductant ABC exporter subunit CydD [Curtobacterium flaccumfaciens pv. betae]MCS0470040.1 thiol reductant ABC exporter subunit CydD [Curtobacterium flaccumfaciens pv. betae]MCS0473206.1 thiol reductant ABC exporter subunit CydD [Curtobacterium flaccumfaciens pv. betae]MCS0476888.1 thiol reductant ABC expor
MKPLDPRLLRLSRTARGFIVAAAGTGVLRTLATIAIAWGIAAAVTVGVDAVGDGTVPAAFGQALALLGGAFVLRAVAAWATDDLAARAAAKVKSEMRTTVLARAAERGPSWLAGRSSAGFATTLGPGLDALDAYFGRYLPQLALTAIATPMLLVAIGLGDLTSGLIILLALPVIPVFMILIGLATQSLQRKQSDALAKLGGAFTEAVEGLATLKVFGRARRQVGRIGAVTDEYRRGTIGVLRLSFVSGFALELAASLSVALVAVSIGIRLVDGSLGLGAAMFVLVLAPEAFAPIRQVGADFHAAQDGVEASAAVLDVLADDETASSSATGSSGTDTDTAAPATAVDVRGLDVRGLTVRRPDVVIGPFDLHAEPGTVVVLAGPSGSGKSSIIAALRGVLPHDGAVTVPGPAGASVAERTTWADQRPRLVRGTIAENVALSATPADADVRTALGDAGLGLDPGLPVGAGGSGLSGGQAQRVAVARALYRARRAATPLVLLDEPTSALDAEAEERVIAAARGLAADGAVVVVASHRPAVVAAADVRVDVRAGGSVTVRRGVRA